MSYVEYHENSQQYHTQFSYADSSSQFNFQHFDMHDLMVEIETF